MTRLIAIIIVGMLLWAMLSRLRQAAGMRRHDGAVIEHRRRSSARTNNRLIMTLGRAGKRFSPFALVCHRGRRSRAPYRTPIRVVRQPTRFVVGLTYGRQVDWYRNLEAARGGQIIWQGRNYAIGSPQDACPRYAIGSFPLLSRLLFWLDGVDQFSYLPLETPPDAVPPRAGG
jgi:hypothetical protein